MKKIKLLTYFIFFSGIWSVNAQYGVLQQCNTNGTDPNDSPILINGKLWGLTVDGGTNNVGCIYTMYTNGGAYKDIFNFNTTNGKGPQGEPIMSGGILYCVTELGGANGKGRMFSIDTNGTGYTDLHDFSTATGANPYGTLVLSGNILYGLAEAGATTGYGCIFSYNLSTSTYSVIHNFDGTHGSNPYWGAMSISGGVLYGMTELGGAHSLGCIFSYNTGTLTYTDIHDFSGSTTDGANPYGQVIVSGTTLYGMTSVGGLHSQGCIFSISTTGTGFVDMFDFSGANGGKPYNSLTLDRGLLYGMTEFGGANSFGNIFSIKINGTGYTDLLNFNNTSGPLGEYPGGNLAFSGNTLYGATQGGGLNYGVVFKYTTCSLTASITSTTGATCGSNGSATITPAAGTSPYTYAWSNGTSTISTSANTGPILSAGTYTVEVDDNSGTCYTLVTVTITQPSALSINASVTANEICNGGTIGSASVTASAGDPPYTYLWSSGATTSSISSKSAATYTITVHDNCGTSASATVSITEPTPVSISIASSVNIVCPGSKGTATANAATGGTPYVPTAIITTVAGNGNGSYAGDGAAATAAEIANPEDIAIDASGNLFIADASNQVVRKVNTSGIITTIAGNNAKGAGYFGDGGQATAAELSNPAGAVVNSSGSIYIVDGGNNVIRMVNTSGIISTVAGNNLKGAGYFGDGGQATAAELSSPDDIKVDSHGNVFIADLNNNVIRKVNSSGIISTIAGNHAIGAGYYGDGGQATAAELNQPYSVAVDAAGDVFIGDANNVIRKVNTSGIISTVAGNYAEGAGYYGDGGQATAAELSGPEANIDASGNIYISDGGNSRIRIVNTSGVISTIAGNGTASYSGDGGAATAAELWAPYNLAIDASGNVYIADYGNNRIRKIAPAVGSPYSYNWTPNGGTNLTASNLTAGSYTVTATDNNGCNGSISVTITQPVALSTTATVTANISCGGSNTGNASASPGGGTSPYTYSWSNGSSTVSTSNPTGPVLSAGSFTVTVRDNCGTTATAVVTITAPAILAEGIPIHNGDVTCNGNNNGSATAATPSGGTSPYTYRWNNGTSSTSTTNSTLSSGIYSVEVTDAHGCTATSSGTVNITQPTALAEGTPTHNSDVSCNGGNNGSAIAATASGGTAPYTYKWNNASSSLSTANASLSAGTYSVEVTDAHGCTATASVTVVITQPSVALAANATVTANVSCSAGNNGVAQSAPSGGTSPYTYLWQGGATKSSISAQSAGTYTITVQDNHGCSATGSVIITQPSSALAITIASFTNAGSCVGGTARANAAAGGTSPYSYQWTPSGGTNLTTANLSGGTYSITATDANSCTAIAAVTITQPASGLSISIASQTNALCYGGMGTATANTANGGTPPYTYSWSDGNSQTNLTATGLSAGTYSINVTDANSCISAAGVTITQPSMVAIIIASQTNATCNTGTGTATANPATGGTSPYSYLWSDGNSQTNLTATGLTLGSYTVTATDGNGCNGSATVTISPPGTITEGAPVWNNDVTGCYGNNNGSATAVAPTGGSAPYTYQWNSGATSTNITNASLTADTYTVFVTDAGGCTATSSGTVIISQPSLVTSNIYISGPQTCAGGYATVTPGGGVAPYTYLWSPGGMTTVSVSGLTAGTYSVVVNDANGCSAPALPTKIGNNPLRDSIVSSSLVQNKCGNGSTGQATDGVKGGNSPYTFLWSNTSTNQHQSGLSSVTYTVQVRDKNNCSATASVTITSPPALTGSLTSVTPATCHLEKNGAASVSAGGGVIPYTYAWTPNVGSASSVSGIGVGAYSVQIKDNNGCTASTIAISITQPPAVAVTKVSQTNITCNGYANGVATVAGNNGVAPYTYTWNPGSYSGATVSNLSAATYTVGCTDNNGCIAPSNATFVMPQPGQMRDSVKPWTCTNNLVTATVGVILGTPPYTYTWSPGGGTKQTMSGLTPQAYTIIVTDKNGCTTTSNIIENLTCPPIVLSPDRGDGNGQPRLGPDIAVYPNPTSGQFTIAGLEQGQIIEMYDYTGRKVSTISANDITMQINLSNQPNGIYLIRVLDKDGILVGMKKVVKTN